MNHETTSPYDVLRSNWICITLYTHGHGVGHVLKIFSGQRISTLIGQHVYWVNYQSVIEVVSKHSNEMTTACWNSKSFTSPMFLWSLYRIRTSDLMPPAEVPPSPAPRPRVNRSQSTCQHRAAKPVSPPGSYTSLP